MTVKNPSGNRIQIYSNGLACVTRGVEVTKAGTPVEIPCKHDHLGDLLSSLIVGGEVTEVEPATFRPDDTAGQNLLEIDPAQAFVSTFRKVSGVSANVLLTGGKNVLNATILGVEEEKVTTGNSTFSNYQLVFSDAGKIRRVGLPGVESVEVTDPIAKAEIDRALRRNLRKIKPGSTFVSMKLQADGNADTTQASVTYVVPVPANSYSYRLTTAKGKGGLVGFAIVHNDTEEDWNNVLMDVVIGTPLTARNNLSQRIHPIRVERSFVQHKAQAGFEVEGCLSEMNVAFLADSDDEGGGFEAQLESVGGGRGMAKGVRGRSTPEKLYAASSFGGPAAACAPPRDARRAVAKATDVDDYAVFSTGSPVTIAGNSSGLVPIIELGVEPRTVLIFDSRQSQTQLFRAMEFVNKGDKTLPFGAVTIYTSEGIEYNTLLGETLALPQLKQGAKGRVPYAPDTNVRGKVEDSGVKPTQTGLTVADGVVVYTYSTESTTTYTFYNQTGKEASEVLVEHVCRIDGSTPEARAEACEKTESGFRFTVKVPKEKGMTTFVVTEKGTTQQQVSFNGPWVNSNVIVTGDYKDLLEVPTVKAAVTAWQALAEKDREIAEQNDRVRNAESDQTRARNALGALKDNDDRGNWNKYLNEAEEIIRTAQRDTLPRLTKEREKLNKEANSAFGKARANWVPKKK